MGKLERAGTTRNGCDGIAAYRTRKNKNKLWANTN